MPLNMLIFGHMVCNYATRILLSSTGETLEQPKFQLKLGKWACSLSESVNGFPRIFLPVM